MCALKYSNVRRRYPKAEIGQSRLTLRLPGQFHIAAVGKPIKIELRSCSQFVEGEQAYYLLEGKQKPRQDRGGCWRIPMPQ